MILPELFIDQMKNRLGTEYSEFESALHSLPPVSIRINPDKIENELNIDAQVPWCKAGYYLKERPVFTLDPFFHAGHYYVQEASSMIVDHLLKYLEIKPESKILDLCSAPGGKSTILLSHLKDKGIVHSHEFDQRRASVLKQNIERWGYANNIVTTGSLQFMSRMNLRYDLILIDAPCSGEGMFRKEPEAIRQWNSKKVNQCVAMQKNIMSIADSLIAENGFIIYSTCTWNNLENEEILQSYVSSGRYNSIPIKDHFNLSQSVDPIYSYRAYPHKSKGEGLTFSVLQYQGDTPTTNNTIKSNIIESTTDSDFKSRIFNDSEFTNFTIKNTRYAVPVQIAAYVSEIYRVMSVIHAGIAAGEYKGLDYYPAHGMSQSIYLNPDIPYFNLELTEAIQYLRAITPVNQIKSDSKWMIAKYRSANLGWFKSGGSGLKNYYPKHLRIISF
jgi:16S rRNA C967 or C1407 C5-methylase (RsmB/RsmF family)/NOL1/NOP2/fmu family ribosome biogenesis protein